jgi:hypothetical protein
MFLGSYRFDGDPADLLPAYDRLMDAFPPALLLWHTCVVRDGGVTVYDACPSEEVFAAFSSDPMVLATMASAGLPAPVVERLGPVHRVRASPEACAESG